MPDLALDAVALPLVKSSAPLAALPLSESGLSFQLLLPGQAQSALPSSATAFSMSASVSPVAGSTFTPLPAQPSMTLRSSSSHANGRPCVHGMTESGFSLPGSQGATGSCGSPSTGATTWLAYSCQRVAHASLAPVASAACSSLRPCQRFSHTGRSFRSEEH